MKITSRTHFERLQDWLATASIPIGPQQSENRWMSPPFPTRRFGPDAWVSCSMHLSPTAAEVGPFEAWLVLDAKRLRVIAYLERPLADAFGVVPAIDRPAFSAPAIPEDLAQAIGHAAERFFGQEKALAEDHDAVAAILNLAAGALDGAWREVIAPDFFTWLAISEKQDQERAEE